MKGFSWLRGRTLATAALTAAVLLVGCSDEAGFDAGPLAPQEASYARGGNGAERGGRQDARDRDGRRTEKGHRVNGRRRGGQVGQYNLAVGRLPNRKDIKSEAEIGNRGGCIAAAGHMLCVPAGVLDRGQTAMFKLQQVTKTLEDGSTIVAVDVKADLQGDDAADFAFGKHGFGFNADGSAKKVYLFLTYDWAENRPETVTAENGAVLYFPSSVAAAASEDENAGEQQPGGVVEVLDGVYTTSWNGRGYLVAPLEHFSEYGIGWPNLTRTVTSTVGGLF